MSALTSDCDEWEGGSFIKGYGRLYIDKVDGRYHTVYAHRLVWMQNHGHIEPEQFICHRCDNPSCINLDHLFLGDRAINAQDMYAKGRSAKQKNTACPQGHEFTPANTYTPPGTKARTCRKCRTAAVARVRARRAA